MRGRALLTAVRHQAAPLTAIRRQPATAMQRKRCQSTSALEPLGLGYVSTAIEDVGRTTLMREMMASIDHPGRAMPGVTSVKVQPALGEAGHEGGLWRRMVVDGVPVHEHIYANPALGLIRRVELEADGSTEGGLEMVTALRAKPHLHMEVFMRDKDSLAKVHCEQPLALAKLAVRRTVELARAKEAQEQDCSFHGNKA